MVKTATNVCKKKKADCGCPTGAAAPCIETKPLNQQTYAYPNSIYSHSNSAQVGEMKNNAVINDSLLIPNYNAKANDCGCATGCCC